MVVLGELNPPTEGILHVQHSTTVAIKDRELPGKGTLYIAESCLSWVSNDMGQGFTLEYPHIALHAVSRDLNAYPHECLYLMVDESSAEKMDSLFNQSSDVIRSENEADNDDDNESTTYMTEIRFVPDDKGMLDAMFHAMSECQALHPDPQDSFSEDEDEEIFDDAEDGSHFGEGDAQQTSADVQENGVMNGSTNIHEPMELEDGQFEDADDDFQH